MMHYEGVLVSSYNVIAEFASVQIIFGATVSSLMDFLMQLGGPVVMFCFLCKLSATFHCLAIFQIFNSGKN